MFVGIVDPKRRRRDISEPSASALGECERQIEHRRCGTKWGGKIMCRSATLRAGLRQSGKIICFCYPALTPSARVARLGAVLGSIMTRLTALELSLLQHPGDSRKAFS